MSLDTYQEQVVNSPEARILCLAGAGAGKSRTLLSRIDALITSKRVLPTSILALTFTNAAAAEMRRRYEISHPGKVIPEFKTFHSFSYGLVCQDIEVREALGYDAIPDIASELQEKEITEKAKLQCKVTLTNDKLVHRNNLTRKEQRQVELYDKAVNRLLRQQNLISFDMLNTEVSKLFVSDHASTRKYKFQYQYVFVDEFQDTDDAQASFLFSFTGSNLMVVGDSLQCIYQFRNCSNRYIKQLSNQDTWKKYKLLMNYRSTNQICEYANKFSASYADDTYRVEMVGQRDGAPVEDKHIPGPTNYSSINLTAVDTMLNDMSGLPGTTAILCRSNREVTEISNYLSGKGIDHTSNHGTKVFNIIECAISDKYMVSYLAAYLTPSKYGEYIRMSANKEMTSKEFLDIYGSNARISGVAKKILALKEISTLPISYIDRINEIKKLLRVDIAIPETPLSDEEFMKYVKRSVTETISNQLYVGTIHSVKGLEYDNVCVANVDSYAFELGDEEMNNLFYVAITRAKNRLFVYRVDGNLM